jgi:hypothetical protein
MRGKLWFLGGLAAGFVLGARAGREKYEELVATARKVKEHPTVQEARGVVQEQANRLMSESKDRLSHSRLAETKVGERLLGSGSGTTTSTTTSTTPSTTPGTTSTGSLGSDSTLATSGSTTRPNSTSTGTTGS